MKWNVPELVEALRAQHEIEEGVSDEQRVHVFRFTDRRLEYILHVSPGTLTAQLSFDPHEPIQACPMLEYSFNCIEIEVAASDYGDKQAVRFYEHRESRGGLRLTLTALSDGIWYTWANAWHD